MALARGALDFRLDGLVNEREFVFASCASKLSRPIIQADDEDCCACRAGSLLVDPSLSSRFVLDADHSPAHDAADLSESRRHQMVAVGTVDGRW